MWPSLKMLFFDRELKATLCIFVESYSLKNIVLDDLYVGFSSALAITVFVIYSPQVLVQTQILAAHLVQVAAAVVTLLLDLEEVRL